MIRVCFSFFQISLLVTVLAWSPELLAEEASGEREWTSVAGTTIKAAFVETATDGKVVLLKANGQELRVSPTQLSEADQVHLAELEKLAAGAEVPSKILFIVSGANLIP